MKDPDVYERKKEEIKLKKIELEEKGF